MAHFDRRRHAHVHCVFRRIVEAYPNGEALSDYDPVQVAADLWQAWALLVRGLDTRAETLNPAIKRAIAPGHGPHRRPIAYGNAGQFRFAEVGDGVPGI
jgi:hypothetical protein